MSLEGGLKQRPPSRSLCAEINSACFAAAVVSHTLGSSLNLLPLWGFTGRSQYNGQVELNFLEDVLGCQTRKHIGAFGKRNTYRYDKRLLGLNRVKYEIQRTQNSRV